jgi:hypothetical protein
MRAVLAACCLLVLAGCGGVSFGPSDDTPPAPGDDPATTVDPAAPGVTADGVTAPSRLADAHAAVLAGTSYVITTNRTVVESDGTVVEAVTVAYRNGSEPGNFGYRKTVAGATRLRSTRDVWRAGDESGWRVERAAVGATDGTAADGSGTTVDTGTGTYGYATEPVTGRELVASAFRAVDVHATTAVGVDDGTTVYELRGRTVADPAALTSQPGRVADVSLYARVDADGLVRHLELSYTVHREDQTLRVTRRLDVENVGSTVVDGRLDRRDGDRDGGEICRTRGGAVRC